MAIGKFPKFSDLYSVAAPQGGYFTTRDAASAGYSPQALRKHLLAGRISRAMHGIYRLVHYPPGEQEQLAVLHLWARGAGVFSHETALFAHGLSDVLPDRIHLTLLLSRDHSRIRMPPAVQLHFADVPASDQTWYGVVHCTKVGRTLWDCIESHVRPDLVVAAYEQALRRGLLGDAEAGKLREALHSWRTEGAAA